MQDSRHPTKDHFVAAVLDERIREPARADRELLGLSGRETGQ